MCLSIPSKVVSIDKEKNSAVVDTMGVKREVGLDLMEEGSVNLDDYVLIHVGFVMNRIDEEDALESLKVYREILEKMDEDERRQTVLEGDNCENRGAP
ncbi:MAG: HypC/HybG/HupF family hydrogenase formation chaperone [Campylobacterales bacterium]